MIRLKDGVLQAVIRDSGDFVCVSHEILYARMVCEQYFTGRGVDLVVTSCLDGKHGYRSLHWRGDADDWRSRNIMEPAHSKKELLEDIRHELGPDYDVVLEDEGGDNEHYHVEWDPKGAP